MQVVKAAQSLPQDPLDGVFCVELFSASHLLNNGSNRAVHQLDEDPEDVPRVIVGIDHIQTEAILASAELHESDLVIHELLVLLGLRGAELEGELLLVGLALDSVHLGEAAGTKLVMTVDVIEGRGIFFLPDVVLLDNGIELLHRG